MRLGWAAVAAALSLAAGLVAAPGDAAQPAQASATAAADPLAGLRGLSPSAAAVQPRALALKLSPVAHGRNATVADLVAGPLPPELASVVVKSGLSPGVDSSVDAALLGYKLHGFRGWSVDPAGPRSVTLKVPALVLPGATVKRFAQDYLERQLSGTAGASVEQRGPVLDRRLFDAEPRLRVKLPDGTALRGDLVLRVDVYQAGSDGEEKPVDTVPVGFLIRRREARLVTTKALHRGDPLGPEDLALVEDDTTYDTDSIGGFDKVAGKVARTFVPAGKVLARAMVDEPVAIQRGDIVRLMVRSGGVVLEASAKALRDARVGETLPLQVLDTDRPVQARCVEPGVAVREAP
jgi:flagella basal body P-ring formation protein FlgA